MADPMLPSDEVLVAKAKAGDKQAFTELYKKYKNRILTYLGRYLGNRATAEDLTVEVFLKAYDHLDSFKEIGSFSSWVYAIATNLAKTAIRTESRRKETSMENPVEGESEDMVLGDTIADERPRADYAARREELKEHVQKILARLPPKYRQALLLRYVEGFGYLQASKVLGCSMMTFATRARRGRNMIYVILKKLGYDLGM